MADSNKIKYGIKNVYYAIATLAADNSATYETPVALPGAVSLSLDAQGDVNKFFADNIVYYTSIANNGYEGDLELAYLPESFWTDIIGNVKGGNDVVYEDANAEPVHFALMFQFEGDKNAKRHVLYNCTATRPTISGQTKEDSIEPQTETVSITATTVFALNTDIVKGSCVEGDAAYSSWFTSVTLPTAST